MDIDAIRAEGFDRMAEAMTASLGYVEATRNTNYNGRKFEWATLSSYSSMIKACYTPRGLVVTQTCHGEEPMLVTRVVYRGVELERSELPLKMFLGKEMSPHAIGSAMTYAKRYAVSSMLMSSADEEDDDARQAVTELTGREQPKSVPIERANEAQIAQCRTGLAKKFGDDRAAKDNFVAEATGETWSTLTKKGAEKLIVALATQKTATA